jgi:hypothetical protein
MADDKNQIPYGTYGRVRGLIDKFAETITPTSLSTHVVDGISGGDFSAVMTSLNFLGLITETQATKPELRELVAARKQGEPEYKEAMRQIIEKAYKPIVGKVDVESGTLPELEKAFKDAGVPQGQMITKVTRFYIKALEDCDVKISDYITKPRPRQPNKNKGTKGQKKAKGGAASDDKNKDFDPNGTSGGVTTHDAIPKGFERLTMPGMKDAFIQYPSKLNKREYDLFKALLTVLGTYVSLDENGEDRQL